MDLSNLRGTGNLKSPLRKILDLEDRLKWAEKELRDTRYRYERALFESDKDVEREKADMKLLRKKCQEISDELLHQRARLRDAVKKCGDDLNSQRLILNAAANKQLDLELDRMKWSSG